MRKVKVGIIGCGYIAQNVHIPNYLKNPHAKLISVADVDSKKLDLVRAKFSIEEGYSDYRDLLARKDIEAVSVCVPPQFHAKVAVEVMNSGKHVLCEKPMALTLDEADKMIESSKKNDVRLMVGYNFRFLPNHQLALRYIKEQRIGKPFLAKAHIATSSAPAGPNSRLPSDSFYFDSSRGGGVLFDTGTHVLDLLLWMFGEAQSVSANLGTHMEGINADDVATLLIQFKSGLLATVDFCWVDFPDYFAMKNDNLIEILGSDGKIESDVFGPSVSFYNKNSFMCKLRGKLTLTPRPIDPRNPSAAIEQSYREEIAHFLNSVIKNTSPMIDGREARKALELALAARNSFANRRVKYLGGNQNED
jgi:predicted dehydrogenase